MLDLLERFVFNVEVILHVLHDALRSRSRT